MGGRVLIFIEETKHHPRLHSHPCFLSYAVCAGSQPAIGDSSNLVVTIPKALFKKGVAALEPFISPDFDKFVLHDMFTCDVVCEFALLLGEYLDVEKQNTLAPDVYNTQPKPWLVDKLRVGPGVVRLQVAKQ